MATSFIRGKSYNEDEINRINRKASEFFCPFLTKVISSNGYIEKTTEFMQCKGLDCMAFDPTETSCLRFKQSKEAT